MSDLSQRLRRLGVSKGKLPKPAKEKDSALAGLPPGHLIETPLGRAFYLEERFPLDHVHGRRPLGAWLAQAPAVAARMLPEPAPSDLDLRRFLFIDTETTGLGSAAGVLPFLTGWGYFTDDAFVVRQHFLRDPGDEAATLHHLARWTQDFEGLVSFNGRGFDLPLLENRFILARLRPPVLGLPHLDLLPPARRVWRGRLDSCALSSLERHVLGVVREGTDVPGWLIPDLYRDYVRSGDASQMGRVFYHNLVDILSLVSLADQLCGLLADPLAPGVESGARVALARWHEAMDLAQEAEAIYRAALEDEGLLPLDLQHAALSRLGALLKRQDRRDEAVPLWVQLALQDESAVEAHVELAMFYEWHQVDLVKARAWTDQAFKLVAAWPADLRREQAEEELRHRLARLDRKIERQGDDHS